MTNDKKVTNENSVYFLHARNGEKSSETT